MPNLSTKYQRDYKDVEYNNPRLRRDKEKQRRRVQVIVLICVAIFVASGVYFFLFSPVFAIRNIEVRGLQKIKPDSLKGILNDYRRERRWFILSKNNFWLFDPTEARAAVEKKYFFEKFDVKKRLPNTIVIDLKEKISAINWLANNLCYHLDLTGAAFEYCDNESKNITIRDMVDHEVKMGEGAVESAELHYIISLLEQFNLLTKNQAIVLRVEKSQNLLDFVPKSGPVVRFNSNLTVEEQISRLTAMLNQPNFTLEMLKLQYIDLRFGEKVYYK